MPKKKKLNDEEQEICKIGRICYAVGWDAGNRNAKANGRTVWTVDDWNAAAAEFNRLMEELIPQR
jgi:hypothetical protein